MSFDGDRNDVTVYILCVFMEFSVCVVTLSGYVHVYTVHSTLYILFRCTVHLLLCWLANSEELSGWHRAAN